MGGRIVLATIGSYGDVNPYVGIALGLRARGHHPVIAANAWFGPHVERAGVEFRPIRPDASPEDQELIARVMHPTRGTQYLFRELIIPSLEDTLADLEAVVARGVDLLVTHPLLFPGPVVVARHGMRWVSTVLAPLSFLSRHDVPVLPPAPWLKRLERIPGFGASLMGLSRLMTLPFSRPIRRFQRRHGLRDGGNPLFEGQHSPAQVLALFSPLLASPQPDWPANTRVTGHVPWNGSQADMELGDGLRRFLDDGPPPVVFTLGSSATALAGSFYRDSAKAARRSGRRAVLLVGRYAVNRLGIEPHPDIHVTDFASHRALFPRAAVTVHQGGAGTLHQALRAGRPMLVVPWAHDQPDNAYRAARLGVARVVTPARYGAARAVRELEALLDRAVVNRAEVVGAQVSAEDGVAQACDAIEAALG